MLLGVRCIVQFDLSKYPSFNGKIEELAILPVQGYCNENYSFRMDGSLYLLRKFKVQDVDREFEFKVQNLAYAQNIAAKAIVLDEEQGLMICEYLQGHHKTVLGQEDLQKLAHLLQKLHTIPVDADALKLEDQFHTQAQEIKEAFQILNDHTVENVLCHNDLNPRNIIFSEDLKLIDWEYAALNDRYFDLAAVSVEFKLSAQDEHYFLTHYFDTEEVFSTEKLYAYKIIYSALCKQWFEKHGVK